MKHEEKLAFWINIHNALMMHVNTILWHIYVKLMIDLSHLKVMSTLFAQAYVEYGIPQNNVKKASLLIKVNIVTLIMSKLVQFSENKLHFISLM